MANILTHESLYRTEEKIEKRQNSKIAILGLGAIGSNLVPLLVKNGFSSIYGIDYDRIDNHNPGNQFYTLLDVGRHKSQILKTRIARELGVRIDVDNLEVEKVPTRRFNNFDLIVDCFDNWDARSYIQNVCRDLNISDKLLHCGLSDQGYSEIRWDSFYRIPELDNDQEDVCEYPMACNLIYVTVSILSEIICNFIDNDEKRNASFTLADMKIDILNI